MLFFSDRLLFFWLSPSPFSQIPSHFRLPLAMSPFSRIFSPPFSRPCTTSHKFARTRRQDTNTFTRTSTPLPSTQNFSSVCTCKLTRNRFHCFHHKRYYSPAKFLTECTLLSLTERKKGQEVWESLERFPY